jgi:hypothetical protein
MSDFCREDKDDITGVYEQYLPHNSTVRELNQAVEEVIDRCCRVRKKVRPKKKHTEKEVKFHLHGG